MAQGKDGYLYLVNRTNLGGIAGTVHTANVGALAVSSGEISNAGAWATVNGTTYVVIRPNGSQGGIGCGGTSGDLVGVKLDPAAPQKMSVAWCASSQGVGSPIITTTDGNANPLVWVAGTQLHAWDLTTGAVVLNGGTAVATANVRRFSSPIVVNGRIFVGGDNQLFALKP
jgi:outer membrane protein assembly factor BamB